MKNKILVFMVASLLVLGLVVACAPKPAPIAPAPLPAPPKPEVIKWRMASTWTPAMGPIWEASKGFAELLNKLSGGRLVVTHYAAGEIVPAFELFDAVSKGVVEAGNEWPSYWAGKNIAFDLFGSQVFGLTPSDHITWTYKGGGLELMRELFGRYNMYYVPHAITSSESGFRTMKPIRTLADYKGLTLRTPATSTMWILEQIGAKPVKIPGGEIYMALKLGTIDGAEFSSPSIDWGMKFHEMTKYWSVPCWFQPSSLLGSMINMDAWKKLPDDLKVIVEEAGKANLLLSLARFNWEDIEATKKFADYGIEMVYLDEASLVKLEELAIKFYEMKAAESPDYAKVLKSMMDYMKGYAPVRDWQKPWHFGRNLTRYPKIP